jgi:hypothetical protein
MSPLIILDKRAMKVRILKIDRYLPFYRPISKRWSTRLPFTEAGPEQHRPATVLTVCSKVKEKKVSHIVHFWHTV